jgi:glycosyltransferase involved in cell wall biosynthesis
MSEGISFIIPAYNEEKLISDCIISIYAEILRFDINFNFVEIIVVDNNSTDRTKEIAENCGAKVISCINKGVTFARQAGFKNAKYEYQAYIDADNKIPLGWLKNLKYIRNSNTVAISGPIVFEDYNNLFKFCGKIFYLINIIMHKLIGPSIQGGNFIVRKSALEKIGGHSTNISFYGEDTDLAARLSKVGKVKLIPSMWIYSSSRRFKNEGIIKTMYKYILNYFSVSLLNKPLTKEYKDYR